MTLLYFFLIFKISRENLNIFLTLIFYKLVFVIREEEQQ